METFTLENDIHVQGVTAKHFPDGIIAAFEKIHTLLPPDGKRRYFGLSRPENGQIVYHAVAEIFHGENCSGTDVRLLIPKGKYTGKMLRDFAKDTRLFRSTFDEILARPGLDPQGWCVEVYPNEKDAQCMVRLAG
ncbi:MAG: transcriptional regulator [Mucilaginibacter polytrichastri]|nr:transcriptional regulator [Mucilaginibacter polytrichastri]